MSLIISVSGIRGTIGGKESENLTPLDIVKFTTAYSIWIKKQFTSPKVIIGRDGRISGKMVSDLIASTLSSMGIDLIDAGLSTTPSIEMGVINHNLQGGIIITASHNPKDWNALKLLNSSGEFLSAEDGQEILRIKENEEFKYNDVDSLGEISTNPNIINEHINSILNLELVNVEKIKSKKFHITCDVINSTGALAIPLLLEKLNCTYDIINGEMTGDFAHNPEPLDENLSTLKLATGHKATLGIAVDPDVDRLALVDEKGIYFGEEYTLVAISDYVLSKKPSATVSNLSSSRALKDLSEYYGQNYFASAVGEAHVVKKMKEVGANIGGEGNGGIIYPELHYGRDSLVGIALLLSYLAESNQSLSGLKAKYSKYEMFKDKIILDPKLNYIKLVEFLVAEYAEDKITTIDGLKIDKANAWVHLRKSNTEPIIRIYSEANTMLEASNLVLEIKSKVNQFMVNG